jgi:hypothetical protein
MVHCNFEQRMGLLKYINEQKNEMFAQFSATATAQSITTAWDLAMN